MFNNVKIGDVLEMIYKPGVTDCTHELVVISVTGKRFVTKNLETGWKREWRKSDGRSVGEKIYSWVQYSKGSTDE